MNFVSNYIQSLEAFSEKNPVCARQSKALAEKFKNIITFAELRVEIETVIQASDKRELFTENPFINQLKRWKIDLDTLDEAFQNAVQTLKDHPDTNERLLVDFINALLKDERSKFHVRGLSLAKQLETADKLTNILQHLSHLPEVPMSESPRQGSFDAMVPENKAQERCLELLRKNSKNYDGTNENSVNTNNLLQTLLSIYKDIDHPEFFPSADPQGFCNII